MITFAQPLWFLAGGLVILLLILFFRKMQEGRQRELGRFASSHLIGRLCANVSRERRLVKRVLLLTAIGCCFVALARPQYGFKWVEVKRKGIDILFAVDTSKSMLAEDVRPNRLQRAKYGIMDFVGQLEGDRVGLLPFAGSAYLMCPMTIDYSAFENSLSVVDTTIIPRGGTDIGTAIREAGSLLSNEANHKILVLITDGENLEGDVVKAAEEAAEKGMTIYTVGVGTSEGELIPISRDGKTGFVKDGSGKFITSQLDEKMLTRIAEATGGLYVPLGQSGEGLQTIYQKKLSLIPKEELAEKRHKVPLERFVWPLGGAIFLLMLEFVFGGRKSERSLRLPFVKTAGRRKQKADLLALLLVLVALTGSRTVEASEGEDAFADGDFLTASQFYDSRLQEEPDNARLHYNYGTAAYKNNLFEDAAKSFSEALKSEDLALQEEAYYNRGNALYKRGEETLQTDAQHSMELWQQALSSFDGALQLNSVHDDARHNMELVRKKLEELKEQEQEKEKQDQEQQQDKEEKGEQGEQGQDGESSDQEQQGSQDKKEPSSGEEDQQQPEEQSAGQEGDEQSQEQDSAPSGEEDENSEEPTAEEGEPAASEEEEKEEQQARARDQQRRQQGKMTREEATQLLNSLKDEEGELNFVPSAAGAKAKDHPPQKDW
ncbi:MAG: VWA domain-containing protein [Thermodesulfobacteriota bacterium]